ncbi:hypothetical protein QO034_13075 [Sedimentitalea sp. JM2-8]|uniref:Nuclease n=1 Tax=Sedimentitalea xiamensis TaxID=3050037 RepID=A0ABT7FG05_9RHOB|nr:hypothetical protein [Sedimentitalea xiamensis]MDK3074047.1 hypothetical protein [Sedimentitalea xiamensis]
MVLAGLFVCWAGFAVAAGPDSTAGEPRSQGAARPETDGSASAKSNRPRIWSALSGDRIELDGVQFALDGVTCPPADTPEGRDAKALLNTFLRAGHVRCTIAGTVTAQTAVCTVNGHNINEEMGRLEGCRPYTRPQPSPSDRSAQKPPNLTQPRLVERRVRPADPYLLWRGPTGLGPVADRLQLLLYSLHLNGVALGSGSYEGE